MRLRWQAAEKLLYLEYDEDGSANGFDWKPLGSQNLTSGNTNWNMDNNSSFVVSISAESDFADLTVSSNVWLDNFEVGSLISPVISTHPAAQNVATGSNATLSVVSSGTPPLSYQWQKGGVNLSF